MKSEANYLRVKSPYYKFKYLFGLLGANSLIVQVVLFRELLVTFSGNELSWGIFFATWLISGAIGSFFYTTLKFPPYNKNQKIYRLFIFSALIFFIEIILVRIIKTHLGFQPFEILPIERIFLITSILIFTPSFIFGALYSMIIDFTAECLGSGKGEVAGTVYSFEAFGAFIAGILFSFLFVAFFTSIETCIAISFINIVYGYLLLNKDFLLTDNYFYIITKPLFFKVITVAAMAVIILITLIKSDIIKKIDDYSYNVQWAGYNFVKQVESKYGKITVIEDGGQHNIYENNSLSFIIPDVLGAEQRIHLTMTYHKKTDTVLMLGGLSGEVKELYKYPLSKLTYVELDPLIIKTATEFTLHDDSLYFKEKNVQTVFADARGFIKNSVEKYDVIILNAREPNTLYANRYFTREFYDEVKSRLNPGGIFSFSIASSPNYLTGSMYYMQASIFQTLSSVFEHIKLISSDSLTFIASNEESVVTANDVELFGRFSSRMLNNTYFNDYLFLDLISNEKNDERKSLLSSEKRDMVNTDFYPKTYFLSILLLGEESGSAITKVLNKLVFSEKSQAVAFYCLIIIMLTALAIVLLSGKKRSLDMYLMIFTSGVASISIEILLLFLFQIIFGYVYYKIGTLIAVFMLGLFAGSYLGNRFIKSVGLKKLKICIISTEAFYVAYLIVANQLFSASMIDFLSKSDFFIFILLFTASLLTGAQYPLANKAIIDKTFSEMKDQMYAIAGGRLYASDLLGAGIGGIIVTLFIVPVFGIGYALKFLIVVKGYSLFMVTLKTPLNGRG